MATFNSLIAKAGKGSDDVREFIYLVDINHGGTLGTSFYSNKTREIEGTYFKGKLNINGIGNINRNIQPELSSYSVSDLSLIFANEDNEFSKSPYHQTRLNKRLRLRLGFTGLELSAYETLFEGNVKSERRNNRKYHLTVGDATHKINVKLPPRSINLTEFPNAGTALETDLIGKDIPYIYGDFSNAPFIKPLYVDTVLKRYLIADHPIGTVVKVFATGTQVYDFSFPRLVGTSGGGANPYPVVAGTHTGTKLLSYIDFTNTQGTKTILVECKGKFDSGGTTIEIPSLQLRNLLTDTNINTGLTENDIGTSSFDISTSRLSTTKFRTIIDDSFKDVRTFTQKLSRDSLADFFFNGSNKATFTVFYPVRASSDVTGLNKHTIVKDTLDINRNIIDLVNHRVINYTYNWYTQKYENSVEVEGTVSINNYNTTKTKKINSKFIYTNYASTITNRLISRYADPINKISLTTKIGELPIDLSDFRTITHNEMPSSVGGWGTHSVQVVGLNINNNSKEIGLDFYDAKEVLGGYFFLGDKTVQGTAYTTASTVDHDYGYLCDRATGQMNNGDSGYRLW